MSPTVRPLAAVTLIQAMLMMAAATVPVLAPDLAADSGLAARWIGVYSSLVFAGAMGSIMVGGALTRRFGALAMTQVAAAIAAEIRPLLEKIDGFVSIERFESLTEPGKILSLSFFRDEAAVDAWRGVEAHRAAQAKGRAEIFADYRLRIVSVIRDYGMDNRDEAPADSRALHG